jgi:hypothetical protein
MITVELTCESLEIAAEPGAESSNAPRYRPVIAINGQRVWHGRPEPTAEDAERVALAYLRYALGGVLGAPADARREAGEGEEPSPPPGVAAVTEAMEALAREMVGALRRVGDFLERGEWRRFLG